jgi:hypothetical protein
LKRGFMGDIKTSYKCLKLHYKSLMPTNRLFKDFEILPKYKCLEKPPLDMWRGSAQELGCWRKLPAFSTSQQDDKKQSSC